MSLSGKFCNDIFSAFETSPSSGMRILWRQIKPFIRGKIPYAPSTPMVRRIIKQVNVVSVNKCIVIITTY